MVPTHGRPELLRLALRSVVAQTLPPAEVIVVDDCLDPAVEAVVAEAAAASGLPIRYIGHPFGNGASSSRNRGALFASCEVLAFLDDDDRWDASYLRSATDAMQDEGRPVVFTWLRTFAGDEAGPLFAVPPALSAGDVLARNPGVTGSNIVLRREAFEGVGGFDEQLWVSNDKDFLVRLLDRELPYAVVRRGLVEKVERPGERLTSPTPRRVEGMRRYYEKYEARFSRSDRRFLRFQFHRLQSRAGRSRLRRVWSLLCLVPLLGRQELTEVGPVRRRRMRRLEQQLTAQGGHGGVVAGEQLAGRTQVLCGTGERALDPSGHRAALGHTVVRDARAVVPRSAARGR